ncbi:MAG: hypothetical protein OER82_13200 [Nitrosopumilus sp.]|nr:hypothetical protein [Nitrosopumilus sp.]
MILKLSMFAIAILFIISISPSQGNASNSQEIPEWVKNNAGWWSEDLILDRDFMQGIEFLGEQGIIKIN